MVLFGESVVLLLFIKHFKKMVRILNSSRTVPRSTMRKHWKNFVESLFDDDEQKRLELRIRTIELMILPISVFLDLRKFRFLSPKIGCDSSKIFETKEKI